MDPRTIRRRNAEAPPRRNAEKGKGKRDWRDHTLARLRASIQKADPAAVEEVKWRRPSNPEGVPVWSHDGIICIGNTLKSAVRLTFPKGARIEDPTSLFNARLDSRTVRAIDFRESAAVEEGALRAIVRQAVRLNAAPVRGRPARGQ